MAATIREVHQQFDSLKSLEDGSRLYVDCLRERG
jgi:hypothetical protein